MSKALFFGLPVHGHTNPTLPLVRELVRRGEEIVYLSTDEFAPLIAATGATYRPYRNAFLPELGSVARRMDELAWLFMRTTAESTLGGGVKAPRGTRKTSSMATRYCSITQRRQ